MKRLKDSARLVAEAYDRKAAARRPCEGESETTIGHIRTITVAVKTLRGAKWRLIRNVVITILVAALLVPVVEFLNGKGIFFASPSLPQSGAAQPVTDVAMTAPPVAKPSQAAVDQTAKPTPRPSATSAAPTQSATAPQSDPSTTTMPGSLVVNTAETVSGATIALSQLLVAEKDSVANTWCSLATALDVAQCESTLGTQWSARSNSPSADHVPSAAVTVGQPTGTGAMYTFPVAYGNSMVPVTIEWVGHQWRLSDADYQQAVFNGGILTSLGVNLTSVVLNVL